MPSLLENSSLLPPSGDPKPMRWNEHQYQMLFDAGFLPEHGCELIRGEIITHMPTKFLHTRCIDLLSAFVRSISAPGRYFAPITIRVSDTNIPDPDGALLSTSEPQLNRAGYVLPDQVVCVFEVSNTSLNYDLTTKAELYAGAEIPEYWVVDIEGRRVIVHSGPVDGRYTSVLAYSEDESVTPLFSPISQISVLAILP